VEIDQQRSDVEIIECRGAYVAPQVSATKYIRDDWMEYTPSGRNSFEQRVRDSIGHDTILIDSQTLNLHSEANLSVGNLKEIEVGAEMKLEHE